MIFRADGSSVLGMGHIMRCLAFADGLREIGARSVFVTKASEPWVAEFIRSRGYDVQEIASASLSEDDLHITLRNASRTQASLLVTDLCHRPALESRDQLASYHESLAKKYFTICLAGGDLVDLPSDILVSPYFRTTYPCSADSAKPLRLLGPLYFIFRREFISAARKPRQIAEKARRVLVAIGGGDPFHLTAKVAAALCGVGETDLSVRVVVGQVYPPRLKKEIEDLWVGFTGEWTFLDHDTNMAEAMLWADLAITGDGLTKYETAVTGTPSTMLSRSDSDQLMNEEFEKAGTAVHLGDGGLISVGKLARKIAEILEDAPLRTLMSRRGKAMVDGRGLERIIAEIPSGLLS